MSPKPVPCWGASPRHCTQAARDPYGARAVIYALLIDPQDDIRQLQLKRIAQHADSGVETLVHQLLDDTATLNVDLRLPLLDLCTPALAQLSADQYRQFKGNVAELIRADDKVDLFEWVLQRLILRHLEPRFCGVKLPRTVFHNLDELREPVRILLSTLARAGASETSAAQHAFEVGLKHMQLTGLELAPAEACSLGSLNTTLVQLDQAAMKIKRTVLEGCVACIGADDHVAPREAELLRGMADSLRCPMPPLLA